MESEKRDLRLRFVAASAAGVIPPSRRVDGPPAAEGGGGWCSLESEQAESVFKTLNNPDPGEVASEVRDVREDIMRD